MLQDKFGGEGPVKHVKLISLEGGDGHVFRSVAKNHRRRPKRTSTDDSNRATEKKRSYFVDEFINNIH